MHSKENANVLVLGVGGNVSMGIIRALRGSKLPCRVLGACVSIDSAGLYLCDSAFISPYADSCDFIPWLVDLCNSERVDIVFSGVEEVLDAIAENISELRRGTSAIFVVGSAEQLEIGRDKLLTCRWLKNAGCSFPHWVRGDNTEGAILLAENYGWPIIAKPRRGKGSNGVFLVKNAASLPLPDDTYVFQENIGVPENEYTVGVYGDKEGVLHGPIIMRRMLKDGMTYRAEVVEDQAVLVECLKICETFQPIGPLNIQLRKNREGCPVAFELNIRYSGSTPMRAYFGFNDVAAALLEYVYNKPIDNCFFIRRGIAFRYWNEVYATEEQVRSITEKGCFN